MTRKRCKQAWIDLGPCFSNSSSTCCGDSLFRVQGTDSFGHTTNMLLTPHQGRRMVEALQKWLAESSVDPRQPNIAQG